MHGAPGSHAESFTPEHSEPLSTCHMCLCSLRSVFRENGPKADGREERSMKGQLQTSPALDAGGSASELRHRDFPPR